MSGPLPSIFWNDCIIYNKNKDTSNNKFNTPSKSILSAQNTTGLTLGWRDKGMRAGVQDKGGGGAEAIFRVLPTFFAPPQTLHPQSQHANKSLPQGKWNELLK